VAGATRSTAGNAPPRTPARMEDDWSHVVLCLGVTAVFIGLGYWKGDLRAFAGASLFGMLVVILTVMNLAQSRR
jgi:hypothetical protein